MTFDASARTDSRDRIAGWTALAGSALAVFAWAACCVLPVALSLAGFSLAGAALLAEQRGVLTWRAAVALAVGWWRVWRRRRACACDGRWTPPSRLTVGRLAAANTLTGLALVWQPLVEPWTLMLLRSLRG